LTNEERNRLHRAMEKVPCALSVATDEGRGAAWLGCRECPRCLLIQAFEYENPFSFIDERVMVLPDNGGHVLREDLRKKQQR
jgi:hypothetical protein